VSTSYYGPGPCEALCFAIQACLTEWDDDPAYEKAAQKLREVQRELEVLMQSPGARQAARLSSPDQSGQEPSGEG
jgi:hypothetical protein